MSIAEPIPPAELKAKPPASPAKRNRRWAGYTHLLMARMKEVKREAKRRKIKLLILPTRKAIQELKHETTGTNAILHVTC